MDESPVALIERRVHPRVRLDLRCYKKSGKPGTVVARTINVSRNGALLLWNESVTASPLPAVGAPLTVDMELPPSARGKKFIRCKGRVVRVSDRETRGTLVALAVTHMSFAGLRQPKAAAPVERPKVMYAGASGSSGEVTG